jgi:hypothetical protein
LTFNIGSQNANAINNVAGDMTINGGQRLEVTSAADALAIVRQLSAAIGNAQLPASGAKTAGDDLREVEQQLARPTPDRATIADRLTSVTRVLGSAGALVHAGAALGTGIAALATWLGPLGAPILHLLSST